jgi:hypothetical protein
MFLAPQTSAQYQFLATMEAGSLLTVSNMHPQSSQRGRSSSHFLDVFVTCQADESELIDKSYADSVNMYACTYMQSLQLKYIDIFGFFP